LYHPTSASTSPSSRMSAPPVTSARARILPTETADSGKWIGDADGEAAAAAAAGGKPDPLKPPPLPPPKPPLLLKLPPLLPAPPPLNPPPLNPPSPPTELALPVEGPAANGLTRMRL